jgi:hypothetical protein
MRILLYTIKKYLALKWDSGRAFQGWEYLKVKKGIVFCIINEFLIHQLWLTDPEPDYFLSTR